MNDRIPDLLDLAADDEGRPLGFTPADLSARGRRARRRRTALIGGGVAAAVVAASVGTTLLVQNDHDGPGPDHSSVAPAETPTGATDPDPTPPPTSPSAELPPQEQAIVDQCLDLLPAADAREAADWSLDAYLTDQAGFTATLVAGDATKYVRCQVSKGPVADGLNEAIVIKFRGKTPVQAQLPWFNTLEWAQWCSPGEGAVCSEELFYGAGQLWGDSTKVVADGPDGTNVNAEVGEHTWVIRHREERVEANRPDNDMQALPSMPVRFTGPSGEVASFDFFPPQVLPESCPDDGGC
ncbi:hypothetical protein [Nocardioides sp. GXZ039]|uniref:hypothetical protein n=1 Tax=Nocardioides sp. GXZ039 TaxID=3136018 RepID=UPI0030F492CD